MLYRMFHLLAMEMELEMAGRSGARGAWLGLCVYAWWGRRVVEWSRRWSTYSIGGSEATTRRVGLDKRRQEDVRKAYLIVPWHIILRLIIILRRILEVERQVSLS
jgi:hypothetical protein